MLMTRTTRERRPRGPVRVVLQRDFGVYFVGNLCSNCGTWFQNIAQALLVYRLTHSTLLVGVANFAQFIGVLALAGVAGAAADRYDRRRLLLATQLAAFGCSVLLAVLAVAGHAGIAVVFGAALLIGFAQAFAMPAAQALVPALVARADLPAAVAMNTVTFTMARALGPVAAVLVIGRYGIPAAFAVNTATYLVLIAALLFIRPRPAGAARPGRRPTLRESWRQVRADPVILSTLCVVAAIAVSGDPVNTLTPEFATTAYHHADTFAGVLIGAFGVGSVVAALRSGRAGPRRAVWSMVAMGLATVAFGLSPTLWTGLLALAVCGYGFLAGQTSATVTLQTHIDDAERGRVMALWSVAWLGTRPFASLLDGALASLAGVRAAAALMAVPVLIGALLLHLTASTQAARSGRPAP
jgi:MFS family permease